MMPMVALDDGTRVHCLVKSEAIVLDNHVEGYFEYGVHINDGDVVLDVGANIGIFAVRAVQKHPSVRVFAFEPVPEIYATLRKNSELHGDGRLVALPCGASKAPGTFKMTYYPKSPALSTGHPGFWDENPQVLATAVEGAIDHAPKRLWYARFVPKFLSAWIARHLRSGARTVECALRTVSSVIEEYELQSVDLLKVDCEGAELDVLLGIEAQHWPRVDKVVAEVHDMDGSLERVIGLLKEQGLTQITVAKEAGFEETPFSNVYASRQ